MLSMMPVVKNAPGHNTRTVSDNPKPVPLTISCNQDADLINAPYQTDDMQLDFECTGFCHNSLRPYNNSNSGWVLTSVRIERCQIEEQAW